MAIDAIQWGVATPDQQSLRSDIRALDETIYRLERHLSRMNRMNDNTDFTELESVYGVEAGHGDNLRDELASCLGKLTTDSSISEVLAARKQLVAKAG